MKDLWEKIWHLEIEEETEHREKKPMKEATHSETKYGFILKAIKVRVSVQEDLHEANTESVIWDSEISHFIHCFWVDNSSRCFYGPMRTYRSIYLPSRHASFMCDKRIFLH